MTAAFLHRFSASFLVAAACTHAAPGDAEQNLSRYAKGVFAELEGDSAAARGHYEATLQADPASFPLARKTAGTQLDDDDLPAATRTLRSFAAAQPGLLDAQLYYADFLEQNAPHDAIAQEAATTTLEQADEKFPHTAAVFSRLINAHENRAEREKSMAVFNAQLGAEGAGPEHWMALAPIARTLLPGDSPELKECLDLIAAKTVETGAGIPLAARTVSDYYRRTDRLEEAIAVLQKHLEIQPDSLELRTRLGLLQIYAKQEEAGVQTLLETIQIDPDQVLAHRALAQFYARTDEPSKALHHGAEALRIAGGAPEEFLDLANQYLDRNEPHQARLLLERASFDHPENLAVAARLAIATLRDGDTTGAALLFRQAEALAKDSEDPAAKEFLDAEFQLEFAGSLREAGDSAAAETRLREAIRNIPPEQPAKAARALRELARLWIEQDKNPAPAAALLKRAEALEPGHAETKELLHRIQGKP